MFKNKNNLYLIKLSPYQLVYLLRNIKSRFIFQFPVFFMSTYYNTYFMPSNLQNLHTYNNILIT